MKSTLNILYRGPLESCNYDCKYCPFAKKKNTREELAYDKKCLDKFVDWVGEQQQEIGILFTPWGEALIRKYYQEAIIELSQMEQVKKVVIQTNLSSSLKWLEKTNKAKTALWTTFHPSEISLEKFLEKCEEVIHRNVNFSVGIVGKLEHFDFAKQIRERLPNNIYVWVNAFRQSIKNNSSKNVI